MDTKDMDFLELNNKDIIDVIFSFNEEIRENDYVYNRVIKSFIKDTPDAVKMMLLLEGITISFHNQEYFVKNSDALTIGYYHNTEKYIAISSTNSSSQIISTMHHEIGHALDHYISDMIFFEDRNSHTFGSLRGLYVRNIKDTEGTSMNYRQYYMSRDSEFFAQSYCEYVLNTGRLQEHHKMKWLLHFIISSLDFTLKSLPLEDLKYYSLQRPTIYFLTPNKFIYNIKDINGDSDVTLVEEGRKNRKLFSGVESFSVFKNDICNDDIIITTSRGILSKSSYMFKDDKLLNLGGYILEGRRLNASKSDLPYSLVRNSDNKLNIVYRKDDKIFNKPYLFNEYSPLYNHPGAIGYGVKDDDILVLDTTLSVRNKIKGKFHSLIKPTIFDDLYNFSSEWLFITECPDERAVNISTIDGDIIDSCEEVRTIALPAYIIASYSDEYSEEDLDDFYDTFTSGEATLLKYSNKVVLVCNELGISITLDGIEDLNTCPYVYAHTFTDKLDPYVEMDNYLEQTYVDFKCKKNGFWYIGLDDCLDDPIMETDEMFITESFIGDVFYIGINFNNQYDRRLLKENILSAEVKSFKGDIHIKDISYDDLISFLEHLREI